MKLHHTKVKFRPYSTNVAVPLLGSMDVWLTNNRGKTLKTHMYMTKGQEESLLGKDVAIVLGILKIDPDGDHPDQPAEERVRSITPEYLADLIKTGEVSSRQTQAQIDAVMEEIMEDNKEVFQGMGEPRFHPFTSK